MATSDEVWAFGRSLTAKSGLAYIAGPLFSEAERAFNLQIEKCCIKAGLRTYLPQRDAPILDSTNGDEVFQSELRANEAAEIIVANLDGIDIDSGTAWEIGYAVARGKTIIGVRTDLRSFSADEPVNLMIYQTTVIVKSLDELSSSLELLMSEVGGRRSSLAESRKPRTDDNVG